MCGLVLALTQISSPAWAGALWVYESGTPDLGTAAAGRAAMALAPTVLRPILISGTPFRRFRHAVPASAAVAVVPGNFL